MKKVNGLRARDMSRLAQAAASKRGGVLDMAMVAVARDGMLRASEIPQVAWGDIRYLPDGNAVLAVPGEDGTTESRPLSPETVRTVAELLPTDDDPAPTDKLFPITASQINRRIRAICRAAGLPAWPGSTPRRAPGSARPRTWLRLAGPSRLSPPTGGGKGLAPRGTTCSGAGTTID